MCLFCFLPIWPPPRATLFPYTTLFRSVVAIGAGQPLTNFEGAQPKEALQQWRSEEHTSELQSRGHLVCRLLLEKKKTKVKKVYINRERLRKNRERQDNDQG